MTGKRYNLKTHVIPVCSPLKSIKTRASAVNASTDRRSASVRCDFENCVSAIGKSVNFRCGYRSKYTGGVLYNTNVFGDDGFPKWPPFEK